MIRVLNIISDTNIGGAGRVLLNYLRYTDRNRFETLVALPRGSLLKQLLLVTSVWNAQTMWFHFATRNWLPCAF